MGSALVTVEGFKVYMLEWFRELSGSSDEGREADTLAKLSETGKHNVQVSPDLSHSPIHWCYCCFLRWVEYFDEWMYTILDQDRRASHFTQPGLYMTTTIRTGTIA